MNGYVVSGGEQGLFLHLFNDFVIFFEAFTEKPRLFIKKRGILRKQGSYLAFVCIAVVLSLRRDER